MKMIFGIVLLFSVTASADIMCVNEVVDPKVGRKGLHEVKESDNSGIWSYSYNKNEVLRSLVRKDANWSPDPDQFTINFHKVRCTYSMNLTLKAFCARATYLDHTLKYRAYFQYSSGERVGLYAGETKCPSN